MTTVLPDDVARIQAFWAVTDDDAFFSPPTIMAVLNVSNNTLTNWRVQGEGPTYFKSGKLIFYRKGDITAWLKQFQPSRLQAA